MSAEQRAAIIEHVTAYDRPVPVSDVRAWATTGEGEGEGEGEGAAPFGAVRELIAAGEEQFCRVVALEAA